MTSSTINKAQNSSGTCRVMSVAVICAGQELRIVLMSGRKNSHFSSKRPLVKY